MDLQHRDIDSKDREYVSPKECRKSNNELWWKMTFPHSMKEQSDLLFGDGADAYIRVPSIYSYLRLPG